MRTRIFVRWNSRVPIPRTDKAMSLDSTTPLTQAEPGLGPPQALPPLAAPDREATIAKQAAEPGRRPVEYTPEIGDTILERLDKFETLRDVCADPGMPDKATVLRWLAQHAEFRDEYAVTPRLQAEALMEETIDIIDDVPSEGLERVQGGKVVRTSLRYALARAVLRNEIRDWVADRLMPKTAP
jgi:hypothetical protein